jgi:hypothetical protein
VNPRLDQNQSELGVLVLAVNLKVLSDGDRLFDEVPKVLRDGWAKSCPQTKRYAKTASSNMQEQKGGEKGKDAVYEDPYTFHRNVEHTVRLEDTKDLVTGDETDLGNTVRVTEGNTDLRWGQTLTGELDDVVDNIFWGRLEPRRGSATVRESRGR